MVFNAIHGRYKFVKKSVFCDTNQVLYASSYALLKIQHYSIMMSQQLLFSLRSSSCARLGPNRESSCLTVKILGEKRLTLLFRAEWSRQLWPSRRKPSQTKSRHWTGGMFSYAIYSALNSTGRAVTFECILDLWT